jgi:hypothetical protein
VIPELQSTEAQGIWAETHRGIAAGDVTEIDRTAGNALLRQAGYEPPRHRRCWEQDETIVCHASRPVAFAFPVPDTIYYETAQEGDIPAESLLAGGEHYGCSCRSAAQAAA